ncbi:hypothetical protein [Roseicella aerolata]|uniref:Uncharacterized protein n=1 Tax=Roseicella aerolata TaxID=2883479 RepID=A0A9X1L6X6_9PROT|nr:hypothetical protein [Roseicella aerolata]MCB4821306.1 hypothetical protein [Roseicella aerolata]
MSRRPAPAPPTLAAPQAMPTKAPAQLPLDGARGVRVTLEGSDLAAVEAAAAELKARFGTRFAVTGRRLTAGREALRISAGLIANMDTVLDAEGIRQWVLPDAWRRRAVPGRPSEATDRGVTASGEGMQAAADRPGGDRKAAEGDQP